MTRLLSGLVLAPAVVGIISFGPPWLFFLLVFAFILAGIFEFNAMALPLPTAEKNYRLPTVALSFLVALSLYHSGAHFAELAAVGLILLFCLAVFVEKEMRDIFKHVGLAYLGVFYVSGLLSFYLLIFQMDQGRFLILFACMTVWFGDILAYYGGRRFGKTPLAPAISPNKTREGSLAGLAGSLAAGLIAHFFLLDGISLLHCLIVAFICGIIGQIGDLVESALKRGAGVKDSGKIIPGHGGVLDRIDSLLFAGPVFFVCFHWV